MQRSGEGGGGEEGRRGKGGGHFIKDTARRRGDELGKVGGGVDGGVWVMELDCWEGGGGGGAFAMDASHAPFVS